MMKIGVFSDVHSNIHALRALFQAEPDVEKWICLGDAVGLFPSVNEVVEALKREDCIVIRGDHEEYLLCSDPMPHSFSGNEAILRQRRTITPENRAFLGCLPAQLHCTIDGRSFYLRHAWCDPADRGERRHAFDFDALDRDYRDFDAVLWGHTHLPLIVYGKRTLGCNPGSAGFPIDTIRKPSYAVLETASLSVQLRRFDFDRERLAQDILSSGYNPKLYEYVKNDFSWPA